MELTYKKVSEEFKQCSVWMPPFFRHRCADHARYAVHIDNGWYWRCGEHKDAVNLNVDGTVRETGNYSQFYPTMR